MKRNEEEEEEEAGKEQKECLVSLKAWINV